MNLAPTIQPPYEGDLAMSIPGRVSAGGQLEELTHGKRATIIGKAAHSPLARVSRAKLDNSSDRKLAHRVCALCLVRTCAIVCYCSSHRPVS